MRHYATPIGAAASMLAAGSAALFRANASAGHPAPTGFGFIASAERPTAGHPFRAVVVVNREPSSVTIRRVRCDAQVGNERLRGRQERYFAPPYEAAADVACTWRIPADAGGKELRLWHYRFGRRVGVLDASGFVADSRPFSWLVKP